MLMYKQKLYNMKSQKIFRTAGQGFENYFAVITVTEDGKAWVKYFEFYVELEGHMTEMSNEDRAFINRAVEFANDYCKENGYTLWSY